MLRQRAISAAILVPPLLVVLVLGGWWIVALSSVATGLAAVEVFRLLARGRLPVRAHPRDRPRRRVVAGRGRRRRSSSGSGLILVAIGIDPGGGRGVHEADPRDGLPTGSRRSSARCTCRCSASSSGSASPAPEPPPARRSRSLGGERGWILVLVLGVWAYDTGAYFIGKRFGRREVPGPHLAVEDLRRPHRRARRLRRRRRADRRSASASRRWSGSLLGPLLGAGGPGRRPRRVDAEARRRREGLGHADPGPRRHPRPGRLVPLRGAGRRLSMSSPSSAEPAGRRRAAGRAARLDRLDRPPGARRPRRRCPTRSGSSRSPRVGTPRRSPSRPRGFGRRSWCSPTDAARRARRCRPGRRSSGDDALAELATRDDVDLVVVGTGGIVSLRPVLAALGPARSSPRPTRRRSSPAATS